MGDWFLGEIRLFSFNFPPLGWAVCDGSTLPVIQNQALFSLLGNTFGGDGRTTFALPDLRGRVAAHLGTAITWGQQSGEATHTLTVAEMPSHTHQASANQGATTLVNTVAGSDWATGATGQNLYASPATLCSMNASSLASAGGNIAHPNMQPYLTINYCIAVQGIYPSRS